MRAREGDRKDHGSDLGRGSARGKRIACNGLRDPGLWLLLLAGPSTLRLVGHGAGVGRRAGGRELERGGPAAGRRGARKKTTCRWARAVSPGARCSGGAGRGVGRAGVGRCAAALAGSLGRGGWRAQAAGRAGAVEWLGRDGGCCAGWAERVENGPWGRGEKGWAAQGFSWACLVWGLGWVEFG